MEINCASIWRVLERVLRFEGDLFPASTVTRLIDFLCLFALLPCWSFTRRRILFATLEIANFYTQSKCRFGSVESEFDVSPVSFPLLIECSDCVKGKRLPAALYWFPHCIICFDCSLHIEIVQILSDCDVNSNRLQAYCINFNIKVVCAKVICSDFWVKTHWTEHESARKCFRFSFTTFQCGCMRFEK